jgi:hypothetical protein
VGHMVIFQDGDGNPGYHQVDALDDAIQHVEHLRNDEGVEQARIFQMEEVTFEFRPYFRVEVGNAAATMADAPPAPAAVAVAEAPSPIRPRTSPWTRPLEQAPAAEAEAQTVEAQPLEVALKAIVGEPAGEAWPEEDPAVEAPAADRDPLSANGARRGLFGR